MCYRRSGDMIEGTTHVINGVTCGHRSANESCNPKLTFDLTLFSYLSVNGTNYLTGETKKVVNVSAGQQLSVKYAYK